MHNHVPTDAGGLRATAVQYTVEDSHNREDHDDLDRNCESADHRAQRPVHEIAKVQFIHGFGSVLSGVGKQVLL